MNPEIGRFLTVDPFEGFVINPSSLHAYLYVANNPIKFTDPSGLMMSIGEVFSAMGLQDKLREMEYVRKVRTYRRKFRGYCRWAAQNTEKVVKSFNELRKMTAKSKFARHHIIQDWAMKAHFKAKYSRGVGMCMPVLGKWGERFSPHWIMNNVQKANKDSEDFVGVAKIALEAAGCEDTDAKKIIKFLMEAEDMAKLFVPK